jgi:hypothetical protein
MRAFLLAAVLAAIGAVSCGKTLRPGYCRTTSDCKAMGFSGACNNDPDGGTFTCGDGGASDAPAGPDGGETGDAPEGGDASDAAVDVPFHCTLSTECVGRDGGAGNVCEPNSGDCVECLPTEATACTGVTPICVGTTCAPCANDTDCAGPGICMTDGHCASDGEVIYVEFKSAGCPGQDGSAASPFCTIAMAVNMLDATKRVVLIRGAADDKLILNTTVSSPVIVGRSNGSAEASVPAGAGTAITVSAGDVLIRDLTVTGGTGSGAKGIVVSGVSTKVSVKGVKISLGTGLGVQADSGVDLSMDRCYVLNNTVGGLLINGATYSIENSVFAGNGFSQVQFSAAANAGTPKFRFNTVVATIGNAAICDVTNMRILSDSIVVGGANCMLVNVVSTAQNFKTMPPYHLMGHVECPAALMVPPPYDIDGDPRVPPIDCGADQFVDVP